MDVSRPNGVSFDGAADWRGSGALLHRTLVQPASSATSRVSCERLMTARPGVRSGATRFGRHSVNRLILGKQVRVAADRYRGCRVVFIHAKV